MTHLCHPLTFTSGSNSGFTSNPHASAKPISEVPKGLSPRLQNYTHLSPYTWKDNSLWNFFLLANKFSHEKIEIFNLLVTEFLSKMLAYDLIFGFSMTLEHFTSTLVDSTWQSDTVICTISKGHVMLKEELRSGSLLPFKWCSEKKKEISWTRQSGNRLWQKPDMAMLMGHLDFFKSQACVTPVWAQWQVSMVAWRKLHLLSCWPKLKRQKTCGRDPGNASAANSC